MGFFDNLGDDLKDLAGIKPGQVVQAPSSGRSNADHGASTSETANKAAPEALERYPHEVFDVDNEKVVVWDDPVVDNQPPQSYAARTVALARQLNLNAVRRTPADTTQPTDATLEAARARREAAGELANEQAAKKIKKTKLPAVADELPPEPDFDFGED